MQDKGNGTAVLYAAKSSPDEGGSIPGQLKRCRKFAASKGYEVLAEYSEEDVSAYRGDRGPELAAALDHAERTGAALVVLHSDRLARGDGKQARHLVEVALWAIKTNVSIHSIEDPSTFENLVMAVVMGERNTEDSRRKGSAVSDGLARRRSEGRRVGGNSYALSWRRNENDERETVPDPSKAPVVDRMNAEFLAGRNVLQIVKGLNADRIPSARGGKWHPATVTAAEWRELRSELEPGAEAAKREQDRLAAQLAQVEASPDLAGVESDLLGKLARIRAAIAGEVNDAVGVEAVRVALLRLFDCFYLHRGTPETAHLELIGDGFWIEPLISESSVEGYDEQLRPVLTSKPLGQGANNFSRTLVRL